MNELHLESSLYLQQHASNPVYWKAWNTANLTNAKENNKLLLISIGYSACHWCHVMEKECFEDNEVAALMNQHFISIKVDREERPDVDAIYMKALQIMTGRGGWPLNCIALPDGRPVWGGTYVAKEEWISTLQQLQQLYLKQPEKMIEYAEKLALGIQSLTPVFEPKLPPKSNLDSILSFIEKWKKSFDWDFGGMARAPKFMMPNNLAFLLRFGHQKNDPELTEFVHLTLKKMAFGGIFDCIGGGFSRYSVDLKWHIPHFEKMLYDNGQLVSLYSNAFKHSKNPMYKEVVQKTVTFISRELTAPNGGFYCALDADSLNESTISEEGAFYVWKKSELETLLKDDFYLFSIVFNCNDFGYWENDRYVLIQNTDLEAIALSNNLDLIELQNKKNNWEKILFNAREKRNKPTKDTKIITSWNAIMLIGFIDAYKAFGDENYLAIAQKNADFIVNQLWSAEGHLWHIHSTTTSSIPGYLEDYSFVIQAFISLYEVTFNEKWLHHAKQITDYCFDHFYDSEVGYFRFTSDEDAPLIAAHFEVEDNVIPASNSVLANALLQLSCYYSNPYYKKISAQMLLGILPQVDYPSAYSNWLTLALNHSEFQKEVAICSENALDYCAKINSSYLPNLFVAGTHKPSSLPFLKDRFVENETLFYVCKEQTCAMPTSNFEIVLKTGSETL